MNPVVVSNSVLGSVISASEGIIKPMPVALKLHVIMDCL